MGGCGRKNAREKKNKANQNCDAAADCTLTIGQSGIPLKPFPTVYRELGTRNEHTGGLLGMLKQTQRDSISALRHWVLILEAESRF